MSKVELSVDLSGFARSKDETSRTIAGASFSSGGSSFPSTAGVSKLGISIAGTHVAGARRVWCNPVKLEQDLKIHFFSLFLFQMKRQPREVICPTSEDQLVQKRGWS